MESKNIKLLKINKYKVKVNYWAFHEIKEIQIRKGKLKEFYIERIIKWTKKRALV